MTADTMRRMMEQARRMHRDMVEAAYDGVCEVYERKALEDPETGDTVFREERVAEGIPCHLSYSSVPAAEMAENGAAVVQAVKLFLAPEQEIKPGSRIEVNQQGVSGSYSRSGKPAVYSSHQEIELVMFRGYV